MCLISRNFMPNLQVYDIKNNANIDAQIQDDSKPNGLNKVIRLMVDGKKIGTIIYFMAKDHLEIQMIRNEDRKNFSRV